ncbi:hypothetical protein BH23BAC1_BH23BAC1_45770 [soil metagenome]
MKKVFVSLMMILALGVSSESFASSNVTTNPESEDSLQAQVYIRSDSMKIDVFVEPTENANLIIRIIDSKGRTIARESVKNNDEQYGVRFDVSGLKDGNYQVEIRNGSSILVENVELQTIIQTQRHLSLQ